MVALQARREQGTHPDLQAAASPDRRNAWAVEVSKGAHRVPNGSRPPSVTPHTRPCLAQSATGSLPRRRGATARVPYWELLLSLSLSLRFISYTST